MVLTDLRMPNVDRNVRVVMAKIFRAMILIIGVLISLPFKIMLFVLVDGWALRGGWYWPQPHNDVVQKLLRKARKGTRVTYVAGNHDEALAYDGSRFTAAVVPSSPVRV